MQIFFVVDELKGLDEKIDVLSRVFDANFKFFVPTKMFTKINDNKFVLENLAGLYERNVNKKIDEYIKSEKFALSDVLLFYSSANISMEILKVIESKIKYRYDSIYLAKQSGAVSNFFKKIYSKIIGWMFKVDDAMCYTKVQYLSQNFMQHLIDSYFNNHIFKVNNGTVIELENKKEEKNNLNNKFKLKKYNICNLIVFFIILIIYLILANLFNLQFYVHFLFIMLILFEIAMAIMLIIHNIFSVRYQK